MRKLDPDDTRPAYLQVAEVLRSEIDAGTFTPGEKLPTHQELMAHFGVALGTVKRALGDLQGGGLVVSRQGQGAYVRTRPNLSAEPADPDQLAELRRDLTELAERLAKVEQRLSEL